MQFGISAFTNGKIGTNIITFPTSFSNTNSTVVTQPKCTTAWYPSDNQQLFVSSIAKTNFSAYCTYTENKTTLSYLAIGY